MRIRFVISFEVSRNRPEPPSEPEQFEHRDNDTMVENAGPQKAGFTIDHTHEPLGPEQDRR